MRSVVYTAIPKFLVYYNLRIGAFVENQGYAANTPWQYTYAMGDKVPYRNLKTSLQSLVKASDEMWIFGEREGTFPRHEDYIMEGIGLTDGIIDEIGICIENNIPIQLLFVDAEEGVIERRHSKLHKHPDIKNIMEMTRNGEQ